MNVDELENLYLEGKIKEPYSMRPLDQDLDIIIHALDGLESFTLTLRELGEKIELLDDFDDLYLWNQDAHRLAILASYYPFLVDKDALVAREDNLLKTPNGDDWKSGYKHALAQYLVKHGDLVLINASPYGWKDWDGKDEKIVGVYNLKEDYWDEFAGTDCTSESYSGYVAEVLYETGECRTLRVEADSGTILREIDPSGK